MRDVIRRPGLSIFNRTFLLLLAALLVAQGIAVALLIQTPIRTGSTELMEVVTLLSSRMPTDSGALRVYSASTPPAIPVDKRYRGNAAVQAWIAHALDVDISAVIFASTRSVHLRGGPRPPGRGDRGADAHEPPPRPPPGPPPRPPPSHSLKTPATVSASTADAAPRSPPEIGADCGPGCGPPPGGLPDAPPNSAPPRPEGLSPDGAVAPDTLLRGDFIVAARLGDDRWHVVESIDPGAIRRIGTPAVLLFVLGLLLLLPLALWFARALSSPIRDFARAADHLGRDPNAPPLSRHGPSEIVLAADSFNAMQARLNRMVAERTHMVGAIAHDLRTPLARLAFRLDRLSPGEREKAQADIEEMKAMITAALDFLRDQSLSGKRERLDFRLLVESVVDGLIDTGRDVTLAPGAPVTLHGDPLALRRMVMNLVDNALKYGQRARLRLHIEHGDCRLEIDDDGPGIDPAQSDRLFMPFFRGEASRNRDTGGIGLGLSAVQSILTSHGGDIQLLNRPEGGLRVTVTLTVL